MPVFLSYLLHFAGTNEAHQSGGEDDLCNVSDGTCSGTQ